MKRKEMVNALGEFLQTQSFNQGNWPTADNILYFLEEQGMAAPFDEDVFLDQKNRWGIDAAHGREWKSE